MIELIVSLGIGFAVGLLVGVLAEINNEEDIVNNKTE